MAENLLIKSQVEEDTFYEFNGYMKSKKRIIQYDGLVEDQEEELKLFQKNELGKEREYTIDANIAKLMKSKKVLGFDKIIEEINRMIKVFTPSIRDVKAAIERLLVKDLLVRDDKDKNLIKYK